MILCHMNDIIFRNKEVLTEYKQKTNTLSKGYFIGKQERAHGCFQIPPQNSIRQGRPMECDENHVRGVLVQTYC